MMEYIKTISLCILYCVHSIGFRLTPKNCAEIKEDNPHARDGEYCLNINQNSESYWLQVYCYNMAAEPSEYITLPAGDEVNFSKNTKHPEYKAEVFFSKIAIDVNTLEVLADDLEFARIENLVGTFVEGRPHAPQWGKAYQCNSCNANDKMGSLQIDLSGTPFRLPQSTRFVSSGYADCIKTFSKSENYQEVFTTCGGACGRCHPDNYKFANPRIQLHVDSVLSPTTCNHVHSTKIIAGMLDQVSQISDGNVNTCANVNTVSRLVSMFAPLPSQLVLLYISEANASLTTNISVVQVHRQCGRRDVLVYAKPWYYLINSYFSLCTTVGSIELESEKYQCDFVCATGYIFLTYPSDKSALKICEVLTID